MLRRYGIAWLLLALALTWSGPAAARYASIVIDADSGKVLHSVNADTRNFPASLTKMMTLYMIFEALESGRLKLHQSLPVSRVAAGRSPSKLGLKRGERIKVRDIIGTLITKSANDAATVAAEGLAGSERRFARRMTRKARQLGMTRTTFRNASGLPHWAQRSTARDIATLARALHRDFPKYYHHFASTSYKYKGKRYRNHNRLVSRIPGFDGLKTGYIRASGFNIAVSVVRNDRRLIAVLFGGKSPRWRDRHIVRLVDRAYRALPDFEPETITRLARNLPRPNPATKAIRQVATSQWSVFVGSFARFSTAHLAVTRAATAVPSLNGSAYSIRRLMGENDIAYVARLNGLSESHARNSCGALQRQQIECEVLPNSEAIGQGSR